MSSGELGPEVQAIRNREKDELIAQISEVVTESRVAGPVLRAALEGWIGMVEGMTLHWSREGALSAEQVQTLLLAALPGVLAAAQALDPSLRVDTRRLSAGSRPVREISTPRLVALGALGGVCRAASRGAISAGSSSYRSRRTSRTRASSSPAIRSRSAGCGSAR